MENNIKLPKISDIVQGGIKGIADGAANIISKLKADPTKVVEAENDLKQLQINADLEAQRIAIEAEKVKQEELRIELEFEKSRLADVADARSSNVHIQESDKASWLSKNVAYMIDCFVLLIWGCLTIYLIATALKLLKSSNVDLTGIYGLYASVTAVAMTIINFHRGSSAGSERKQKQLEKMNK